MPTTLPDAPEEEAVDEMVDESFPGAIPRPRGPAATCRPGTFRRRAQAAAAIHGPARLTEPAVEPR